MQQPVKEIVNTSDASLFPSANSASKQGLIFVNLERRSPNESWGFRLQGGKDRGLAFQMLKAKKLIKDAGNQLELVIERGDHIVPSMNDAFPNHKKKDDLSKKQKPYYQRQLEETGELPGQKGKGFTTVGKPKMATKQYNSPLEIYGEEALEEIMQQGTLFGKEIDVLNPWNSTGKQLDLAKSDVLSQIINNKPADEKVQSQ